METFISNLIIAFSSLVVLSCATSTEEGATGVRRSQLMAVSSEEVTAESIKGYEQTKADALKKGVLDKNPAQYQRVVDISKKIIQHTATFRKDAMSWPWEVHVISSAASAIPSDCLSKKLLSV